MTTSFRTSLWPLAALLTTPVLAAQSAAGRSSWVDSSASRVQPDVLHVRAAAEGGGVAAIFSSFFAAEEIDVFTVGTDLPVTISDPTAGGLSSGFGADVAILDDMTGDGVSDYAVSAPLLLGGTIYVFSGQIEMNPKILSIIQPKAPGVFGSVIEAVSDVNADGLDDLAVAGTDAAGEGYVDIYVTSAATSLKFDRRIAVSDVAFPPVPGFGKSLLRIGADLAIGSDAAVFYVDPSTGAETFMVSKPSAVCGSFADVLVTVGDLDADGVQEVFTFDSAASGSGCDHTVWKFEPRPQGDSLSSSASLSLATYGPNMGRALSIASIRSHIDTTASSLDVIQIGAGDGATADAVLAAGSSGGVVEINPVTLAAHPLDPAAFVGAVQGGDVVLASGRIFDANISHTVVAFFGQGAGGGTRRMQVLLPAASVLLTQGCGGSSLFDLMLRPGQFVLRSFPGRPVQSPATPGQLDMVAGVFVPNSVPVARCATVRLGIGLSTPAVPVAGGCGDYFAGVVPSFEQVVPVDLSQPSAFTPFTVFVPSIAGSNMLGQTMGMQVEFTDLLPGGGVETAFTNAVRFLYGEF